MIRLYLSTFLASSVKKLNLGLTRSSYKAIGKYMLVSAQWPVCIKLFIILEIFIILKNSQKYHYHWSCVFLLCLLSPTDCNYALQPTGASLLLYYFVLIP